MRSFLALVFVIVALFSVGVWAQQPEQPKMTYEQTFALVSTSPEAALNMLTSAANSIMAKRDDFVIFDRSAATIAAALKIYRVYVPVEVAAQ